MEGTMAADKCGATRTVPWASGLVCDKAPGHDGDHRGYLEVQDEVLFWPPPPRVEAVDLEAPPIATARAWLDRQIVKDGREPELDEGDCRLCGSPSGERHDATDLCGIVAGLLDVLEGARRA